MDEVRVTLSEGGTVTIPDEYRSALGWRDGDELLLRLEQGSVRVIAVRRAIEHAQALTRRYVPRERSLADELIEERRLEAGRG
jgi:bifunctional DNA-binding transcriptional regulator/antitoxin component of YhaV-PrlF toxin-antitoxin module